MYVFLGCRMLVIWDCPELGKVTRDHERSKVRAEQGHERSRVTSGAKSGAGLRAEQGPERSKVPSGARSRLEQGPDRSKAPSGARTWAEQGPELIKDTDGTRSNNNHLTPSAPPHIPFSALIQNIFSINILICWYIMFLCFYLNTFTSSLLIFCMKFVWKYNSNFLLLIYFCIYFVVSITFLLSFSSFFLFFLSFFLILLRTI